MHDKLNAFLTSMGTITLDLPVPVQDCVTESFTCDNFYFFVCLFCYDPLHYM